MLTVPRWVIMASTEGGVEIEKVAEETPHKIIKEWIDPNIGLQGFQVRKIAFALGLEGNALKEIESLDQAIESYENAIKLNPKFIDPYTNLAIVFASKKNENEKV